MRFTTSKDRRPPTIIIISLIDILIVLLIFLMVTTTFKEAPSIDLTLPESTQAQTDGVGEDNLIVTVSKVEPYFYIGQEPIEASELQTTLKARARENPNLNVVVRADKESTLQPFFEVLDALTGAGIKRISAHTKGPPAQE